MDAASLIVLMLFFIGVGVVVYYLFICFQGKPKVVRWSSADEGPLLHSEQDHNGNLEDTAASLRHKEKVGIQMEPDSNTDQPDSVPQLSKGAPLTHSRPFDGSSLCRTPHRRDVLLTIQEEPPETNTKCLTQFTVNESDYAGPVIQSMNSKTVHDDDGTHNIASAGDPTPLQLMHDSDEGDGLRLMALRNSSSQSSAYPVHSTDSDLKLADCKPVTGCGAESFNSEVKKSPPKVIGFIHSTYRNDGPKEFHAGQGEKDIGTLTNSSELMQMPDPAEESGTTETAARAISFHTESVCPVCPAISTNTPALNMPAVLSPSLGWSSASVQTQPENSEEQNNEGKEGEWEEVPGSKLTETCNEPQQDRKEMQFAEYQIPRSILSVEHVDMRKRDYGDESVEANCHILKKQKTSSSLQGDSLLNEPTAGDYSDLQVVPGTEEDEPLKSPVSQHEETHMKCTDSPRSLASSLCLEKLVPGAESTRTSESTSIVLRPMQTLSVPTEMPSDDSASVTSESSGSYSDSDLSESEVTEYSFQTGVITKSAQLVLASEVSSALEPLVMSYVLIPEGTELSNCSQDNKSVTYRGTNEPNVPWERSKPLTVISNDFTENVCLSGSQDESSLRTSKELSPLLPPLVVCTPPTPVLPASPPDSPGPVVKPRGIVLFNPGVCVDDKNTSLSSPQHSGQSKSSHAVDESSETGSSSSTSSDEGSDNENSAKEVGSKGVA